MPARDAAAMPGDALPLDLFAGSVPGEGVRNRFFADHAARLYGLV